MQKYIALLVCIVCVNSPHKRVNKCRTLPITAVLYITAWIPFYIWVGLQVGSHVPPTVYGFICNTSRPVATVLQGVRDSVGLYS